MMQLKKTLKSPSSLLKRAALAAAFVTAFGFATAGSANQAEAGGCGRGFYGGGGGFHPGFYGATYRGFYGPGFHYGTGFRGGGFHPYGGRGFYSGRRGVSFAIGF